MKGLHIILCFIAGLKHKQAVVEVKVDKETITDWYSNIREVQMIILSQPGREIRVFMRKMEKYYQIL